SPGNLLASATGERGGTVALGYTPSSAFANTNNPPVVYAVTSATVGDGRGGTATTTYSYAGGLYDRIERRFLGFHYAKTTQPAELVETAGPYTETWYHQGYGFVAMPDRVDSRTGSGTLLRSQQFEYTAGSTGPGGAAGTPPFTQLTTGVRR